jgi:hypothetical protein
VPFGKPLAPFERWIPRLKPARKIAHTLRVLTWNICGTPGVSKVRARVQPNTLRMRLSAAATPKAVSANGANIYWGLKTDRLAA